MYSRCILKFVYDGRALHSVNGLIYVHNAARLAKYSAKWMLLYPSNMVLRWGVSKIVLIVARVIILSLR